MFVLASKMLGVSLRILCLLVLASLGGAAGGPDAIKHVVTLMMENHSFNNLLGWLPGIGDVKNSDFNLLNSSDPTSPKMFASGLTPLPHAAAPRRRPTPPPHAAAPRRRPTPPPHAAAPRRRHAAAPRRRLASLHFSDGAPFCAMTGEPPPPSPPLPTTITPSCLCRPPPRLC